MRDYSVKSGAVHRVGAANVVRTPYGGRVYRSNFEASVAQTLTEAGISHFYEMERLPYQGGVYVPDFTIDHYAMPIVEAKGWLNDAEQRKLVSVIRANPDREIVLCLQNPHRKLYKGKDITGASWARTVGISYTDVERLPEFLRKAELADEYDEWWLKGLAEEDERHRLAREGA